MSTADARTVPPDDVTRLLSALRRRWWVVLLAVLLAVGAALLSLSGQRETYSAAARLNFSFNDPVTGSSSLGRTDLVELVSTQLEVLESRPVIDAALAAADPEGAVVAVDAEQVPGTAIVEVRAVTRLPQDAAVVADAVATTYVEQRDEVAQEAAAGRVEQIEDQAAPLRGELSQLRGDLRDAEAEFERRLAAGVPARPPTALQNQVNQLTDEVLDLDSQVREAEVVARDASGGVQVLVPAVVPEAPDPSGLTRTVVLAGLLGLVLGLGAVAVLESVDDRLRTREDLARAARAPVLTTVPRLRSAPGEEVSGDRAHHLVESFRELRAALTAQRRLRGVLLVTSAGADEGKSWTAAQLARACAEAGQRVLLVDADLRRPSVAAAVGLETRGAGLTDVLAGARDLTAAVRPVGVTGTGQLDALTRGTSAGHGDALLGTPAASDLLDAARATYDLVVLDSPPVLAVADALVLAGQVDGVLLAARVRHSRRRRVEQACEKLEQAGGEVLGVVLHGVDDRLEYRYESDEDEADVVLATPPAPERDEPLSRSGSGGRAPHPGELDGTGARTEGDAVGSRLARVGRTGRRDGAG